MLPAAALGGPLAAIGEFVLLYMELATAAMVNQCQSRQARIIKTMLLELTPKFALLIPLALLFFAVRTFLWSGPMP